MPQAGGSFDIDLDGLTTAMDGFNNEVGGAMREGMKDIGRSWKQESRDEAPIDTGELRRQISRKLNVRSDYIEVEMSSNTYNGSFNYSYYQHEVRGNKYLDTVAEENTDKWRKSLEDKLEAAAKKAGW